MREFGAVRMMAIINQNRDRSAKEIVDAIFEAVQKFRGDAPPNDDMTAVAVRITT